MTDEHVAPGFEDVYHYLWKEGTLPVNVDPFKRDLKDSEERKTLRRVLEAGLWDHCWLCASIEMGLAKSCLCLADGI